MALKGTYVKNRFGEMENLGDSSSCHHLHSHSAIERALLFPKNVVLVDEKYEFMFDSVGVVKFEYDGVPYIKVPILAFVRRGGVFRNFIR